MALFLSSQALHGIGTRRLSYVLVPLCIDLFSDLTLANRGSTGSRNRRLFGRYRHFTPSTKRLFIILDKEIWIFLFCLFILFFFFVVCSEWVIVVRWCRYVQVAHSPKSRNLSQSLLLLVPTAEPLPRPVERSTLGTSPWLRQPSAAASVDTTAVSVMQSECEARILYGIFYSFANFLSFLILNIAIHDICHKS